ncbi:hypothetical protein LINPERHAP2_LOCUS1062, partial [Linum perenne]
VEDIVDTGNTLASLIREFEWKGASAISVCAFLDKPARRKVRLWIVESTTEALSGPREDATRIGSTGVLRRQADELINAAKGSSNRGLKRGSKGMKNGCRGD